MKRTVWLWQLIGFACTALGGTLLHYLYEFTDRAVWIAPFSGVNESTWEHMKLLFWPMLLFAMVESLFFRDYPHFWCVKLRGTLLGLVLIPVLFYTYNGVIGQSPDWLNISIFFVCGAIAYGYETVRLIDGNVPYRSPRGALLSLLAIGFLFGLFTFYTPHLGIFRDPIDGTYGIAAEAAFSRQILPCM